MFGVLSGLAYAICVYFLKINTQLPDGGGDKGLILLLEPVITYFIDVTFLGKASSTFQVCGALLTIFAVYIGSIRPPEKVQPLPPANEQKHAGPLRG